MHIHLFVHFLVVILSRQRDEVVGGATTLRGCRCRVEPGLKNKGRCTNGPAVARRMTPQKSVAGFPLEAIMRALGRNTTKGHLTAQFMR